MIDRNFNVSVDWTEFETPRKIKKTNPDKKRTRIIDTSLDYYFSEVFKKAMCVKTPHLKMYKSDNLRDYIYFETLHFLYQNKNDYFHPREIKNFILTNKKLLGIKNIDRIVDDNVKCFLYTLKDNDFILTKIYKGKTSRKVVTGICLKNVYSYSSKFDILLENDILNNEKFRKLFFNNKKFNIFTLLKANNLLKLLKENTFCTPTDLNKKLYYFTNEYDLSSRFLKKLSMAEIINEEGLKTNPKIYWCNF